MVSGEGTRGTAVFSGTFHFMLGTKGWGGPGGAFGFPSLGSSTAPAAQSALYGSLRSPLPLVVIRWGTGARDREGAEMVDWSRALSGSKLRT